MAVVEPRGLLLLPQQRSILVVLSLFTVLWFCPRVEAVVAGSSTVTIPEAETGWRFSDLSRCDAVTHHDDPCIQYDIRPPLSNDSNNNNDNNTSPVVTTEIITLVQVTDWECEQFRDGPVVAVNFLNAHNDNRGISVGFHPHGHYVQFRFVSVVAGDDVRLGREVYTARHEALLRSAVTDAPADYIVGTCSKLAAAERAVARDTSTVLLAQVGPPSFYRNDDDEDDGGGGGINPWVLGMHVSSDEYTVDATRRLKFWMDEERDRDPSSSSSLPVHVIYRAYSEFFRSTCEAAARNLRQLGFTDVRTHVYDPEGDDDGDGTINVQDKDFFYALADRTCPQTKEGEEEEVYQPALFLCTVSEQDWLLERWRQNGCRPSAIWLTASTWAWATTTDNQDAVAYFQGAGQWHPALGYSDPYFASGTDLLDYAQERFGYRGGYDMVVSYSIPMLIAEHLRLVYRVQDEPRVLEDLRNPSSREQLRRQMVNIKATTLFGPVAFDRNQRNSGREAAASQWLPTKSPTGLSKENETATPLTDTVELYQALVSPISHAEANAVVPAAAARYCPPGTYVDEVKIAEEAAILQSRCTVCPIDTYQPTTSKNTVCTACPMDATTQGLEGADACIIYDDALLSPGLVGFGSVSVILCWLFAGGFFAWSLCHVKDPVVSLAQIEYLGLICLGAMISSLSIIGLSFQASFGEDTSTASLGCQAVPFLYSIGWVLQYASLSAKTYRLARVVNHAGHHRVTVPRTSGVWILLGALMVDLTVIVTWTLVSPLEYIRHVESESNIDGLIVIESSGQCRMSSDISIWTFAGPILANHLVLMLGTHYLLDRVRIVNQRYQEKRYIGMASVLMVEVALIGVPVLVAAGDSVESVYVILSSLVTLDSLGVLILIFVPKIHHQRKGLEDGVGIGESVLTETHEKAVLREKNRSSHIQVSRDVSPVISFDEHCVSSDLDETGSKRICSVAMLEDDEVGKAVTSEKETVSAVAGFEVPEQSRQN